MNNSKMINGNVISTIIIFAFPIMLTSLIGSSYALVDNIIVGRYVNTDALAAVGNVSSINSFIGGTAFGLTSGFTIPVAQAFGAGNSKKLAHFAGNSVVLSGLIGFIILILGHIFSMPLLKLIGTPDDIIKLSASYINIVYFGFPFQMLGSNFVAISRAVGDSKKPLYFSLFSTFLNFALDLIFIKHFKWGIIGAASATLISQIFVAIITGTYIFKYNKDVNIKREDLKVNKKTAWYQIKLGIPVSLQFTITSIGSMCLQSTVNSFGANVIAGFTVANRIENLANTPLSALGVATQTFVGQNYGAKKYKRIVSSVRSIFVLSIIISAIMSVVLYFGGSYFASLFMTEPNPEILHAAKRYLLATAQCFSMVAILFILRNSLQGMGYTYSNMVAGIGELVGRLSIAFIFSKIIGFNAICYAAPFAWLMADIPLLFIYLSKEKKFKNLS